MNIQGFAIDFSEIKQTIGRWIDDNWDHAFIGMRDDPVTDLAVRSGWKVYTLIYPPTAEHLARILAMQARSLAPPGVRVTRVSFYETATSCATYTFADVCEDA